MPAKSKKQQKFIFAKRNEYKNKSKTPDKWKWIWDEDWKKIEKSLKEYVIEKKYKRKINEDDKEYRKFFYDTMKKFRITHLEDLKDNKDKAKKFYDYIDKNWKAKNESNINEAIDKSDEEKIRDIIRDELADIYKFFWIKRGFWTKG